MKIIRSLTALVAATLITSLPVPSLAQFTVGVGFTIGQPPPPLPYYEQPPAPYPNYQWNPGYWAWGPAGYYWVPGTWVAPAAVGLYWTPGYWGYNNGYYGWNNGYWGATVGFYGGINYGYGYPGTGFYGGAWRGGNFAYNTAVVHVNRTVIHNTYNKTVVNKYVCNNCKNVSYNGGHGGISAKPTPAQIDARRHGRPPERVQVEHAHIAAQDRNLAASINHGKPPVTATGKPFNDNNKPKNFAPVTANDKKMAQNEIKHGGNGQMPSENKNQQGNHQSQNQGNAPKHNQNQGNPPKNNQMEGNPPKHNQNQGTPPKHNTMPSQPQHHTTPVQMNPMQSHPQSYNQHPPSGGHQQSSGSHPQSSGSHPQSSGSHPQSSGSHPQNSGSHPQNSGGKPPNSGGDKQGGGGGGKPPAL